ncbi:pilin [Thioalkalicoccus limnaeus]|uniref:Pilin n=1 Tax=Thioalkalicoccus limnaeus TaxID=120681 RepID=A0ABV4BAB8_9GAMM
MKPILVERTRIISPPGRLAGITLIELMVSVAVVGILAALALPAYESHVVRSKTSEGLSLASGPQVAVMMAYQDLGHAPADNAAADLPDPAKISGQYVEAIEVQDGHLRIRFNDSVSQLAGRHLILGSSEDRGSVTWCCYSPDLPSRYLPADCRGDGAACVLLADHTEPGTTTGTTTGNTTGNTTETTTETTTGNTTGNTTERACPVGYNYEQAGNSHICKPTAGNRVRGWCPEGWDPVGRSGNCSAK